MKVSKVQFAAAVLALFVLTSFLSYSQNVRHKKQTLVSQGHQINQGSKNAAVNGDTVLFTDNFDSYIAGQQLACQNPTVWTTWSSNPCDAVEDANVSNLYSYSSPNSVVIVPNNDLVKTFGSKTSGTWYVSFQLYIPNGKTGHFNLLSSFTPNPIDWGMDCLFNVGGNAVLYAGTTADFNYAYDTWQSVLVIVDLDNDYAEFWFNGTMIAYFQWTTYGAGGMGPLQLDASGFYGTANNELYFDDYRFSDSPPPGVPGVYPDFTANVTGGQLPLLVQFADLSEAFPDSVNSWEWDFNGDGVTDATEQNPTWVYNDLGVYTVSLTVSNGPDTNSLTKVDYIVPFNPGSILVWEGEQGGANYSGIFIRDYLQANNREVIYLTSSELPSPMNGLGAVFLSFGNWGIDGSTYTAFTNDNAETIVEYLQSGGYFYLDGSAALGFTQANNTALHNLMGLSSASVGIGNNTPVTHLAGQSGTLTEGMLFTSSSQTDNYYIDIFVPNSTGQVAFNETTVGDVAVQNTGSFGQKTFCFSYALAKLNDETFPSTRENLLSQILGFFDITVPVELTSFTGSSVDGNVTLNWSTASEVNNQIFEIERRKENSDFVLIGFVEGRGTTTESQEYSYIDRIITPVKYFYRLKQIDFDGTFEYSNEIEVDVAPVSFSLEQNYPNPFNPSTKITYSISHKSFVTLKVYDPLGSIVSELVGEEKEAGRYEIDFNASELSSGVYFYRIEAGSFNKTSKMILMR